MRSVGSSTYSQASVSSRELIQMDTDHPSICTIVFSEHQDLYSLPPRLKVFAGTYGDVKDVELYAGSKEERMARNMAPNSCLLPNASAQGQP